MRKKGKKRNGAAANCQTLLGVLKISHLIVKMTSPSGYEPRYKYATSGAQRG